jgi:hypothetical protein
MVTHAPSTQIFPPGHAIEPAALRSRQHVGLFGGQHVSRSELARVPAGQQWKLSPPAPPMTTSRFWGQQTSPPTDRAHTSLAAQHLSWQHPYLQHFVTQHVGALEGQHRSPLLTLESDPTSLHWAHRRPFGHWQAPLRQTLGGSQHRALAPEPHIGPLQAMQRGFQSSAGAQYLFASLIAAHAAFPIGLHLTGLP